MVIMVMTYRLVVSLLSALAAVTITSAELADDFNIPKGWKMQDRYHGFRYEAVVGRGCQSYAEAAQAAADELACFGWVQRTSPDTIAGEGRCSKATGQLMQERLRQGPGETCKIIHFEAKDYEDTKIKLHFSHFKILDEERLTCFRDAPHQCPEFSAKNTNADGDGDVVEADSCGEGGCAATAVETAATATSL